MEIADQLLPFTKAQSALSFLLRPWSAWKCCFQAGLWSEADSGEESHPTLGQI